LAFEEPIRPRFFNFERQPYLRPWLICGSMWRRPAPDQPTDAVCRGASLLAAVASGLTREITCLRHFGQALALWEVGARRGSDLEKEAFVWQAYSACYCSQACFIC
jgi:hypothetical protein